MFTIIVNRNWDSTSFILRTKGIELMSSGSAVAAAKADASSNELIKAVIANLETSEGRSAVQDARESGGEMICARLNDKVADARSNMNAMKRTSG